MNKSGIHTNPLIASQQVEQMKRASLMNLNANFHLARKAAETYFEFSAAKPEIAREAMTGVAHEHSRIYMDYLQKLTRLNEELADRILDASRKALAECIRSEKAPVAKRKSKPKSKPKRASK